MMGEFNKENPYIIQICENIEPLKVLAMDSARLFTRNLIIGFLVALCSSLLTVSWVHAIIFLVVWGAEVLLTSLSFRYTMQRNPLPEIMRILYGNQYEKIYVNNEKLLQLIEAIAAFKSNLLLLNKINKWAFFQLPIIMIPIVILRWIVFFFS